jgi:hypothetical protein
LTEVVAVLVAEKTGNRGLQQHVASLEISMNDVLLLRKIWRIGKIQEDIRPNDLQNAKTLKLVDCAPNILENVAVFVHQRIQNWLQATLMQYTALCAWS